MTEEVTIKKSISLRQDIYEYALEESEKKHGGNFSAYLTYLISCQKNNPEFFLTFKNGKEVIVLTNEKIHSLLYYEQCLLEILDLFEDSITIVDKTHLTLKSSLLMRIIDKYVVRKSMGLEKKYDISITL